MGQAAQYQCESDCGCSHEKDTVWEPNYPEPLSYVMPTRTDDIWEDLEDLVPCHCGPDDDADEFRAQPVYPELGSYIQKSRSPRLHNKVVQHQLSGLTELSQGLADAKVTDTLDPDNAKPHKEFYTGKPPVKLQVATRKFPDKDELLNFTPQFLSTVPGARACQYAPCLSDEIDVEVKRNLGKLDAMVSRELCLRRKRAGVYEIDGRQVGIYWRRGGFYGGTQELYAHEDVLGTSEADDVPLSVYLQQVAHVLSSTQKGGASAIIAANMTFADVSGTAISAINRGKSPGSFSSDRSKAMQMACSQAELRKAASQELGLNGMTVRT